LAVQSAARRAASSWENPMPIYLHAAFRAAPFAFALLVFLAAPALAQETDLAVDLWPVLEPLFGVLGSLLLAGGLWLVKRLAAEAGLNIEDRHRAAIYSAFDYGIGAAVKLARDRGQNIARVEVQNDIARAAARYVVNATPAAVKAFGLTEQDLEDRVFARLGLLEWMPTAERDEPAPAK